MRLNEFSKENLDEYGMTAGAPSYGAQSSNAVPAAVSKVKSVASGIKKAVGSMFKPAEIKNTNSTIDNMKTGDRFDMPDSENSMKKTSMQVISQAGEQWEENPDEKFTKNAVIQNTKDKSKWLANQETGKLEPINTNESSELLSKLKDRDGFAKKIRRKERKLKHLLRAAKYKQQGEIINEINFNNAEVIKSALDAKISCGFEAETIFTQVDAGESEDTNLDGLDWREIEELVREQEGSRAVDTLIESYESWKWESNEWVDVEQDVFRDHIEYMKRSSAHVADFMDNVWEEDNVDSELWDDWISFLAANEEENPDDNESEAFVRYIDMREDITDEALDMFEEWASESLRDSGEYMDDATDKFENEYGMDYWAEQQGGWQQVLSDHRFYIMAEDPEEASIEAAAAQFEDFLSQSQFSDVRSSSSYHGDGINTSQSYWRIEPDSSISTGNGVPAEIISPVYETPRQMLMEMNKLFNWMKANGVETDDSTGLHVTMSMPEEYSEPNRLKMALLLGDKYLLKNWNREFNTYTKSQQDNVRTQAQLIARDGNPSEESIQTLEKMLGRGISSSKFSSINFKDVTNDAGNGLIEFRIGGGEGYEQDFKRATKSVVRYAATMEAGHNPEAYREDYLKAMVKTINSVSATGVDKEAGQQMDQQAGASANTPFYKMFKQHVATNRDWEDQARWIFDADNGHVEWQQQLVWLVLRVFMNTEGKRPPLNTQTVTAMRDAVKRWNFDVQSFLKDFVAAKLSSTVLAKKLPSIEAFAEAYQQLTKTKVEVPADLIPTVSLKGPFSYFVTMEFYNALKAGNKPNLKQLHKAGRTPTRTVMLALKFLRADDQMKNTPEYDELLDTWSDGSGDDIIAHMNAQDTVSDFKAQNGFVPVDEKNLAQAKETDWMYIDTNVLRELLPKAGVQVAPLSMESVSNMASLEEQLAMLDKIDRNKLDEAWKKSKQAKMSDKKPKAKAGRTKHPLDDKLVGEGALPEFDSVVDVKSLMSKPLLGSDLKGQMRAYSAIPDPQMIKEFRKAIAAGGPETDLRYLVKAFAQKLHPQEKKQLGLSEGKEMRLFELYDINEAALSPANLEKRNNFATFVNKIKTRSSFTTTDGQQVVIDPRVAAKLKTTVDLINFKQGARVMFPIEGSNEVVPMSQLLKTAEFGGTAEKETGVANRGELAEGVLGAATFARIAKRPGTPITYEEVLHVISSLPKTETGGTITQNVGGDGSVTDKISLTVRLGANTYGDLINIKKLTADAKMNSYIKSTVQFVNDYTRLYADFFEKNGRADEVEIISDGVSENTARKTDVYMVYVDENNQRQLKHFDISLKAGTVKQFGQVGYGRASSPIETRFAKVMELFSQFGIDQSQFEFDPTMFTNDDSGIDLIRSLYQQAARIMNNRLSGGGDREEYNFLHDIADGVTYFATSNDPTVKLLQLDAGKYYVMDFRKLKTKLADINLAARYAETKSGDPIIQIHDANTTTSTGKLFQIRTKTESSGYIRQIIEKEALLKKLISVRHVKDIER